MNFNRKKIAIALAFSMAFQSSSIFASGYEDIRNHWAKDTITSFTEKGYVNGYSNNAFMPNEGITRAEFITLLNKSLNLKGKGNISFKDVNKKDWFYEQLAIAISNGYISGYGDNTFRPNEKVSRAEVCVMLAKLYGLSSSDKDDSSSVTKDEKQEIKELQEVPKWARASIKALIKADILGGYGSGSYGLTKPITRAESVVTVSKVMKSEDAKKIERVPVRTDEGSKHPELPVPAVPEKPQLPPETPKPLQNEIKTVPAPSSGGGGKGGGGGNSISSGESIPSPLAPKETAPVQESNNNVSPEGNRLPSPESGKDTSAEEKKVEEKKPETPKPEQNKKEGEQSGKEIDNKPDKKTENKPESSQKENISPSPEKEEPKEPKLPNKPESSQKEKVEPSPEKKDGTNPPSSNQENNATNPPQAKEDETKNNVTEENQSSGSDKEEENKPSLPEKEAPQEPKLPDKPESSQKENGTPSPEKKDGANPPSSNQENNSQKPPQSKEETENDAKEENKPSLPEKEVPQEPKLPNKPEEKKPQPTPKDPENTVPPAIDPPAVNPPQAQPLPNVPPEDKKTPEEKQAQELWNRLSTKKNNNLAQYTDEDGRIRTILWAKGITPPQMGEGKDFEKNTFSDFITYQAPYLPGNKWYDTNKTKDGGNTFADRNLCFAAVSSNALHWWLEQNEYYVTKFIKEQEEKGVFLDSQKGTFKDLRLFIDSFQDQQQSKIFNMYKYYYYGKNSGFQSDILVDLFINGYKPKENAGVNDPDFNYDPQNLDPRGGFFHSVFGRYKLTDRTIAESYNHFNTFLKNAFSKGELAAVSHTTSGSYTHIITIWGIELDIKGNIVAIYISDSDDQNEGTNVGMKRYNVNNANGKTKLSNNVKNPSSGSTVVELQTFSLGEEKWQEYFKENNF